MLINQSAVRGSEPLLTNLWINILTFHSSRQLKINPIALTTKQYTLLIHPKTCNIYQMETPKINFISLGCAKNQVDAEKMLGSLAAAGFILVGPDDYADATIINTCGFIEDARNEAIAHIQEVIELKAAGKVGHIIVAGCLAQLWGEKLLDSVSSDIDAIVRLDQRDLLPSILQDIVNKKVTTPTVYGNPKYSSISDDLQRLRLTDQCWSYLRISEGCDRHCSYCTIPSIRGSFRSKPLDMILTEARELISDGAVELNLIGQETSRWGIDIPGSGGLATLLRELNKLDGIVWLRIMYTHPDSITDEIIDAIAECDRVVPYIDMPLQHINDRILKLMNRKVDKKRIVELIKKLRERIPGLILRTTMIVGFPSETAEEYNELVEFVKETKFDMLGAFSYSPEPDTAAAALDGHIDEDLQFERLEKLMIIQQEIAFEKVANMVGSTFDCLLTNYVYEDDIEAVGLDPSLQWFHGRSAVQGPEVDSITWVAIDDPEELVPGMIIPVKVVDSVEYDLIAVPHAE